MLVVNHREEEKKANQTLELGNQKETALAKVKVEVEVEREEENTCSLNQMKSNKRKKTLVVKQRKR